MFRRQVAASFLRKVNFRFLSPSLHVSRETNAISLPIPSSGIRTTRFPDPYGFGTNHRYPHLWTLLCGQAVNSTQFEPGNHNPIGASKARLTKSSRREMQSSASIIFGMNANIVLAQDAPIESSSGNDKEGDVIDLRKVEDASVVSNIHTSKWRIFTDKGRDFFLEGKLEQAEKFFHSALQEAKQGFGERDPHVASACNNLAELYRVKRTFDKAEPLYLEAIKILEESYGPEDIRVGAALHNLGHFYVVERKLELARACYERALKIKRRILGLQHLDYADTMFHLGMVVYRQGKIKESEALIQESIKILEDGGQGESNTCLQRLRYLVQVYMKSNRPTEAAHLQKKILYILELTKGWSSLETIIAAEGLALTLQSRDLPEAQELLERCLEARKTLLPDDHIQIGANMLHIAKVAMLKSNQLSKIDISKATAELDKAKDLLGKSIRIAQGVLNKTKQRGKVENYGTSGGSKRDGRVALLILLRSLDALALLEISKQELHGSKDVNSLAEAENTLCQCISTYREFGNEGSLSYSLESKAEYLSCMKRLSSLIIDSSTGETLQSKRPSLQELNDEIKQVEDEMSSNLKHRS